MSRTTPPKECTGYVLYYAIHFQDGSTEEHAKCVNTIEAAQELMNKYGNGFDKDNVSFRLFELGRELKISSKKKIVKRVAEEKMEFKVEN